MLPSAFHQWLADPHPQPSAAPPGKRPPLIMAVLNLTPDSFSDGGEFSDPARAADFAARAAADGAHLLDLGAESTRPGSSPVAESEQLRRLLPVLRRLRDVPLTLSIDTTRAAVARAALDAGVTLINDVSAGRDDPALLPLAATAGAPVVLMHMRGTPLTMQHDPTYTDVTAEVSKFLTDRRDAAMAAGVPAHNILLDPGIGFGKTDAHNLALLRNTARLAALGAPLVIGSSRKGFIGRITGEPVAARRQFGTAATTAWAVANGAAVVRVHDVGETAQVVAMTRAIQSAP